MMVSYDFKGYIMFPVYIKSTASFYIPTMDRSYTSYQNYRVREMYENDPLYYGLTYFYPGRILGEGAGGAHPTEMKPSSSYLLLKFVYLTSQISPAIP